MSPAVVRDEASAACDGGGAACAVSPGFDSLYEDNVRSIWRAARRLGIDPGDTDDVVQEVFVIAHRRLRGFEGRSAVRTWLFQILVRVVRRYFRTQRRKPGNRPAQSLDAVLDLPAATDGPAEVVERAEAVRILDGILSRMDPDKREVFVLAEIEQMPVVDIAVVLEANVNTMHSRLRVARQEFERALARFQRRELGAKP